MQGLGCSKTLQEVSASEMQKKATACEARSAAREHHGARGASGAGASCAEILLHRQCVGGRVMGGIPLPGDLGAFEYVVI